MRQQPHAAGRGEQAERRIGGQPVVRHQRRQGDIDGRPQAGLVGHLADEARDHRWRIEQRQQCRRARIAIGVEVVAEAGQGRAGRQVVRQHRVLAQPLDLAEQGLHAARGIAMQRAGQRGQPGQEAGRQRGPGRRRDAGGEGRARQLVVDQQHQRRAQQLGDRVGLVPAAREAAVQRLVARRGTEGLGQRADQALALHVQHPGQPAARGMPDRRQAGQRREGRAAPGRRGAARPGRPGAGEVDRLPRVPQQSRRVLQAGRARQRHDIPAAIVGPALEEGAQRRRDAGLGAEQRVGGDGLVLAAGLLAPRQAGDVLGAVEAAARVRRVGHDLQLAPADIGIDRLRPHSQEPAGLVHRHPRAHRHPSSGD